MVNLAEDHVTVVQDSYEVDLVEGSFRQTQGSYAVNFVEDFVTEMKDGSEKGMVEGDITKTQGEDVMDLAEDYDPEARDNHKHQSNPLAAPNPLLLHQLPLIALN